ncbi:MAG: DUF456 domain-containing protein [Verrucomicrobia bacterium]|nr:DUF456 domain-containing protein [Verrucomicrobiota bacterium]
MLEIFAWGLTVVLMLGGLVGVVLPLLPGTTLILGAVFAHKLLLPPSLGWMTVGMIGALWALSILADFAGVALGTRWFGGGKWGMAGASGGALVGVWFSLPALLLGTVLGAVAAEKLLGRKSDRDALKAGVGAATGFVLATVARLICAFAMILVFAFAVLSRTGG